jgi:hypothetical protein
MEIQLTEKMRANEGWGHEMGLQLHNNLRNIVEAYPTEYIYTLSLSNLRRADASFCREGILALAKFYREKKGFCLVNISNEDLVENIDVAAIRYEQPITYWQSNSGHILGPQPSEGLREILAYVLSVAVTSTTEVATVFGLKSSNASNKLNQLWKAGYILRREKVAESGGLEHQYFRIK